MGAQRYEMTTWESMDLLCGRSVGRWCIVDNGYPLAIPVNYRIVGEPNDRRVVVLTAPDTMVGRYEGRGSLEVDDIDLDNGTAWSVIVRGDVQRVHGVHELPDPEPLLTEGRHQWLTMQVTAVSGRRFEVRQALDGYSVDWQIASV